MSSTPSKRALNRWEDSNAADDFLQLISTSGSILGWIDGKGNLYGSMSGGGGGDVASVNTLVGAITLAAGSNITITPSGNTLTFAATGSGGAVSSVFGRTGAVVAAANDYSFAQLSGQATVSQINASGTPSSTTFLRGDGTWSVPAGGAVASVFGRTGAVVSAVNDYAFNQISGTLTAAQEPSTTVNSVVNDTNVTGSIAAQALTLGWTGTVAAGRLNSNVVQSVVNDTNVTGSISAQALTLNWASVLSVARGGIGIGTLTGIAKGNGTSAFTVAASADVTALWSGTCNNTTFLRGDGSCQSPSGSGTVNAATQFSLPYYSTAGSATVLSGVTGPTTPNGVPQFFAEVPSGGVATAPQFLLAGVTIRTVSTTSDTIAVTDRSGYITYSNASPIAIAIPQAGSAGFASGFVFGVKNLGAGAATFTPTTSTIDGAATLVINQGDSCTIYSDNTNYFSRCAATQLVAGTNITFTRTANGLTIASTGGGASTWNAITNPSGNLALTMGTNLSEWDYATALANAWKITNNTAATVTTPQSSPTIKPVCGQEWTGAGASTEGCLQLQYVPGTGLNVQSTVQYTNTSSSTNGNLGHVFSGKLYTATSSGAYNVNTQGNRVAVMDTSGFQAGSGSRGLYFANTANVDAGGIDAGYTRVAAGLLGVSNGSAGDSSGLLLSGNKVFVTTNFTTAANTSLQTITGLTWNLPAIARNYSFTCHLAYSQATGTAAVALGVQAATAAPTNIFARGVLYTSATVFTTGVLATLNTTTATSVVSGTPSATATNFVADLSGTIENSANANAFNIMVSTATSGDAVTILRGSYCTLS